MFSHKRGWQETVGLSSFIRPASPYPQAFSIHLPSHTPVYSPFPLCRMFLKFFHALAKDSLINQLSIVGLHKSLVCTFSHLHLNGIKPLLLGIFGLACR